MPTSKANSLLAKHILKWDQCTACPLGKSAFKHVLYEGTFPSKFFFIGEAPGEAENLTGVPFIGEAGQTLRKMFKEVGLKRKDYCLTNILACFPPEDNNPTNFRVPRREEVVKCYPRVINLIKIAKPQVVILLGSVASKYYKMLIEPNLTKEYKIYELQHPSYINRQGGVGSVEYKRNLLKLKDAVNG